MFFNAENATGKWIKQHPWSLAFGKQLLERPGPMWQPFVCLVDGLSWAFAQLRMLWRHDNDTWNCCFLKQKRVVWTGESLKSLRNIFADLHGSHCICCKLSIYTLHLLSGVKSNSKKFRMSVWTNNIGNNQSKWSEFHHPSKDKPIAGKHHYGSYKCICTAYIDMCMWKNNKQTLSYMYICVYFIYTTLTRTAPKTHQPKWQHGLLPNTGFLTGTDGLLKSRSAPRFERVKDG